MRIPGASEDDSDLGGSLQAGETVRVMGLNRWNDRSATHLEIVIKISGEMKFLAIHFSPV
jgi:hypothetical protein